MSWIRFTEDNDVYVYEHADGSIVINANRESGFSEDRAADVAGVVTVLDRLVSEGVKVDPEFHARLKDEVPRHAEAHRSALAAGQYACRGCWFAGNATQATEHGGRTGHILDSPSHFQDLGDSADHRITADGCACGAAECPGVPS
jgi:hypothetical protein